jgi:2-dehydropantoate 2-reductase
MKIAIFGAGAIGGLLGLKLVQAGAEVTFIARGPHLEAMRKYGVTLISEGKRVTVRARCTSKPEEVDSPDYAFVTLKAHSLAAAAPDIAKLLRPQTTLVIGVNGIPYWYFYGLDCQWRDRTIESVDPDGMIWRTLPPSRVIGCVVYPAAEVIEPGVIEHTYGNRFTLGEPDGSKSNRIEALAKQLIAAGLKAPIRAQIRDELWVKLWGNLCLNPLSALTTSTLDRLAGEADLREVSRTMMKEAQIVAEQLGVKFGVDLERRIDGALEVGAHKTSMLQDLERGRPIEIDALLGAVVELGDLTGHAMPMCRAILALTRERARRAGCYSS